MKRACAVCGRERDESTLTSFYPTPVEKQELKRMGEVEPLNVYYYCRACIRILANPTTAIPLMKGVIQFQARSVGVPVQEAEAIAERYAKKVLLVTTKSRS